jgi:hypothetical protein
MPYKRAGKNVMHLKNGKWSIKQRCSSVENAEAAIRLLNAKEHNPDFVERG